MRAVVTGEGAAAHRWRRAEAALGTGAARLAAWPVPGVVAGFVALEWLAVLALARTVRHNGWVYYQGGDQLWYYTLGWLLGHGELTQTPVGYGWSYLLTPISWIFRSNLVAAYPAIVLLNVLVLLPVGMACLYRIASRIGGRLFGYWTLALWLVVPFIGVRYTNAGYHQRYTELTLPQSFGLTAIADFPTMIATLVMLYFCARVAMSEGVRRALLIDGAAAGGAAGFAIAIKPANSLVLMGPALMFVWSRRYAAMGAFVAALTPALLALAVWKARGLGNLPLLGSSLEHHAAKLASAAPVLGLAASRYFDNLSWSHLTENVDSLREHFWSGRVLVWLVLAGMIGLARRSRWAAFLLGGSLLPITLIKASYPYARVDDASVFRLLMPCFPIFVVLLASVPLLLPGAPPRLAAWRPAFPDVGLRFRTAAVATAVVVTAIVPLVTFAAVHTSGSALAAGIQRPETSGILVPPIPANVGPMPTVSVRNGAVTLRWPAQRQRGGRIFYRVLRARGDGLTCQTSSGARTCGLVMPEAGATRDTKFVDKPNGGTWTYRIAYAANWLDDPAYGDPYFFSPPVTVRVPTR